MPELYSPSRRGGNAVSKKSLETIEGETKEEKRVVPHSVHRKKRRVDSKA